MSMPEKKMKNISDDMWSNAAAHLRDKMPVLGIPAVPWNVYHSISNGIRIICRDNVLYPARVPAEQTIEARK